MSDKAQEYDGKCHATSRRTGEQCRITPAPGAVVCRFHGGNLAKVKNAAKLRVARDEATKEALARLKADKGKSHDTITEMDRLAAEVIVFKDVCRERLDELLALDEIRYKGQTGEQLRAEVALYERALDRCNTVLATNIKLNIHEKKAELEKQKAILVAAAFRETLAEAGLTEDASRLLMKLFSQKMLAISAEVA